MIPPLDNNNNNSISFHSHYYYNISFKNFIINEQAKGDSEWPRQKEKQYNNKNEMKWNYYYYRVGGMVSPW
jgi:hypothetical protein